MTTAGQVRHANFRAASDAFEVRPRGRNIPNRVQGGGGGGAVHQSVESAPSVGSLDRRSVVGNGDASKKRIGLSFQEMDGPG